MTLYYRVCIYLENIKKKLILSHPFVDVKLVSKKFDEVQPDSDELFNRVKLILCTPQCTRTAVSNPIEFMLMEGDKDTYNILRDLSHGRHNDHATEAGKRHLSTLKHALRCEYRSQIGGRPRVVIRRYHRLFDVTTISD